MTALVLMRRVPLFACVCVCVCAHACVYLWTLLLFLLYLNQVCDGVSVNKKGTIVSVNVYVSIYFLFTWFIKLFVTVLK